MNTVREERSSSAYRPAKSTSTHRAHRNETIDDMDDREAITRLLPKIRDEKLIRRVWRLLDTAYNEQ